MRFEEYPERWQEIEAIFPKSSILKGSFDRYADSNKKKRGTASVDDAFLSEIEAWRETLAQNIAMRNPQLSQRELKPVLKSLYYPDFPYEFSVLPSDILGRTYEQFLGKVIRLTAGHRAVVEDKPEVKKAGGVYYTPSYIVEYIVNHTVGA